MQSLGVNIGSSSVKVVMLDGDRILWSEVISHEGNFHETLKNILIQKDLPADLVYKMVKAVNEKYFVFRLRSRPRRPQRRPANRW